MPVSKKSLNPIPPTKIQCRIGAKEYTFEIRINGKMKITPTPDAMMDEKISFAFMGIEAAWTCTPEEERSLGDDTLDIPLTSGVSNMHLRYRHLKPQSQVFSLFFFKKCLTYCNKEIIQKHMKTLLNIKEIRVKHGKVNIFEDSSSKYEIAMAGACRKIFATLVLLFSLVETSEHTKLFLVEEPEAQLHPRLQQGFINIIRNIAKTHNIQCIFSTNSSVALDLFPKGNIFTHT